MTDYVQRLLDPFIADVLGELPAVLLVGARAVGKTTTAVRHARDVVRLDREAEAAAFRADPDVALRGLREPVLIDEWQMVPSVLGAVKRAVDADARPGRFLLTGSVRADLDVATWPGTGRLARIVMDGLVTRELAGKADSPGLFSRLLREGVDAALVVSDAVPDLRGYLEMTLAGAFPAPRLQLAESGRRRWLRAYLDQVFTRDASQIDGGRDPARLRRYFEALAASTSGLAEAKKLYDAAGINAKTAAAYDALLANLFIIESLPAWSTNRLKRLARAPKRYVVDPALVGAALQVDADGVLREGDLMGRMLDTFVMSQVRAEIRANDPELRAYHLRLDGGRHEVDILLEAPDGRLIGIEVKADSAPASSSARHLAWLRDELGDRFVAGMVLHTGPRPYVIGDRLLALPICCLWA
jgi:predicted AAA+ superfamily ATPase